MNEAFNTLSFKDPALALSSSPEIKSELAFSAPKRLKFARIHCKKLKRSRHGVSGGSLRNSSSRSLSLLRNAWNLLEATRKKLERSRNGVSGRVFLRNSSSRSLLCFENAWNLLEAT
ncbi:hypothetical protein AAC387_Pa11g2059 [Persea americana]